MHSPASSDHSFHLIIGLFCTIEKWEGTDADGWTDDMCDNSDHHRLWLWSAEWIKKMDFMGIEVKVLISIAKIHNIKDW